ncbi:hypothetical protein [Thermomonas sp. S9]|nr:hypothetical protein [Thermomonas sp. S9]
MLLVLVGATRMFGIVGAIVVLAAWAGIQYLAKRNEVQQKE